MKIKVIPEIQLQLNKLIELLLLYAITGQWSQIEKFSTSIVAKNALKNTSDSRVECGDYILSISIAHEKIDNALPTLNSFCCGKISLEDFSAIETNTTYNIGSVTKFVIVNLLCKMLGSNMLSLNDNISRYINIPIPNLESITVKHLVSHTSGLVDNINLYMAGHPITNILSQNNSIMPDEKFIYSNCNYVILCKVIESVSKSSINSLLEKYITTPLGLKNTFFYDSLTPQNRCAIGYQYFENLKKYVPASNFYIWGASNIRSTPQDLTVIAKNFFTNPEYMNVEYRNLVINSIRQVNFEYFDNNTIQQEKIYMGYGLERKVFDLNGRTVDVLCISGYQSSNQSFVAYVPCNGTVFAFTCTQVKG